AQECVTRHFTVIGRERSLKHANKEARNCSRCQASALLGSVLSSSGGCAAAAAHGGAAATAATNIDPLLGSLHDFPSRIGAINSGARLRRALISQRHSRGQGSTESRPTRPTLPAYDRMSAGKGTSVRYFTSAVRVRG